LDNLEAPGKATDVIGGKWVPPHGAGDIRGDPCVANHGRM